MITKRESTDRGHFDFGWLNTYHTFSFGDYHDPNFMGFRTLRVINEDRVKPGQGFGTHPHRDMEIITYVLQGELAHKDSMGNGSVIRPDDVQYMSAGTGVTHSEFNNSKQEEVHLLQIWILPKETGLHPQYDQKYFPKSEKTGKLKLVVSSTGENNSIAIRQDVRLFASILESKQKVSYEFAKDRFGWLQLVRGALLINGKEINAGDGIAISNERKIEVSAQDESEFLLFDLN